MPLTPSLISLLPPSLPPLLQVVVDMLFLYIFVALNDENRTKYLYQLASRPSALCEACCPPPSWVFPVGPSQKLDRGVLWPGCCQ